MDVQLFLKLTVLNLAYWCVIGASWTIFVDIFSSLTTLSYVDWIWVCLYWLPFVIAYIGICVFYGGAFQYNETHKLHPVRVITLFFGIIFCRDRSLWSIEHNASSIWCDENCSNPIVIFINVILTYLVTAIICAIFPLFLVGCSYYEEDDDGMRNAGIIVQLSSTIIYVPFHLFVIDYYGYYSVIIIIFGLFHIFMAISTFYIEQDHLWKIIQTKWFIFEVLLLCNILCITFIVEYKNYNEFRVKIIFLAIYLFPNMPFSKLFLFTYYQKKIKANWLYEFITADFVIKDEIFVFHSFINDRIYSILHCESHLDDTDYSLSYPQATEYTVLLIDIRTQNQSIHCIDTLHAHKSMQCFKIQYDQYWKYDHYHRHKALNVMLNNLKKYKFVNGLIHIYIAVSIIATFYPVFWFGYYWIHTNVKMTANVPKFVFIWIMSITYFIFIFYVLISEALNSCFSVKNYMELFYIKKMLIFITICFQPNCSNYEICLKQYTEIFDGAETLKSVLDSKHVKTNVALLILSYLI